MREILMYNCFVFWSDLMGELLKKWHMKANFRDAYRPSGNGIMERHHHTIKSIAQRGNISPEEAVFWFNSTP